jgi:hypothetical protein
MSETLPSFQRHHAGSPERPGWFSVPCRQSAKGPKAAYRPTAFSILGRASRNTRVITAWGAMLQKERTHTRHSTAQHGTAQAVSTPKFSAASKPQEPAGSFRAWPVGARSEPTAQGCGGSCCLVAWPRCGGFAGGGVFTGRIASGSWAGRPRT